MRTAAYIKSFTAGSELVNVTFEYAVCFDGELAKQVTVESSILKPYNNARSVFKGLATAQSLHDDSPRFIDSKQLVFTSMVSRWCLENYHFGLLAG